MPPVYLGNFLRRPLQTMTLSDQIRMDGEYVSLFFLNLKIVSTDQFSFRIVQANWTNCTTWKNHYLCLF